MNSTSFNQAVSEAMATEYMTAVDADQRALLDTCLGPASVRREDLAVLYSFCRAIRPENIVEIGLATGSTAVCNMLAAAGTIRNYAVIDPFQSQSFENKGIDSLRSCAPPDARVRFYEERSYIALPRLLLEGDSFDYAFIDGSHMFDETLIEFFLIDKLLKVGGVIVMDDRAWPMVGAVINFIKANYVHYEVDDRHRRLTFAYKKGNDIRRWYDFRRFDIPQSQFFEERMRTFQREQGSAYDLS